MIRTLQAHESSSLPAGEADFLLAASAAHAGDSPGKRLIAPARDAEYISTGNVFSAGASADMTPALFTRAVHTLTPFTAVKILDLGLTAKPQQCTVIDFGIEAVPGIGETAPLDAKALFEKGRHFGRTYKPVGDYVILAESIPADTPTADAAVAALGTLASGMSLFEKLGQTADGILMFTAGFVLEACRRFPVVLGGGKRMAAALLIANRIVRRDGLPMDPRKITLCTARSAADNENTNPAALLEQLDFRPRSLYADLPADAAAVASLCLYDDSAGAGAAIAYGYMHGLTYAQIIDRAQALMPGGS